MNSFFYTTLRSFISGGLYRFFPSFFLIAGDKYDKLAGFRLGKRLRELSLRELSLRELGESYLTLLQIGSGDHAYLDPFVTHAPDYLSGRVILIEPVPEVFKRLRRLYSNENIEVINCAIGERRETKNFWIVGNIAKEKLGNRLPPWWNDIGSFDVKHIERHLGGALSNFKEKITVKVRTIEEILSERQVSNLFFLHIDAEGFDFEILKAFPFATLTPHAIMLEHVHLSKEEKQNLERFLSNLGYVTQNFGKNLITVLQTI